MRVGNWTREDKQYHDGSGGIEARGTRRENGDMDGIECLYRRHISSEKGLTS